MSWKNMTIGKKIGTGFGVVILLLIVLGAISFTGVGGIVKNASEVIDGTSLDGELAQKEVDHLNWIMEVNKLLSDDTVHELHVETDHTQCGFGKWLYGEGRKNAEILVPSLIPLFKEIEEPHRLLHESAISISGVYTQADQSLPGFLAQIEISHLLWAAAIEGAMLNNEEKVMAQTDHTLCKFGKWLYGEDVAKTVQLDAVLAGLLAEIKEPHKKLHDSAKHIIAAYRQVHPGLLDTLRLRLDDHRIWAAKVALSLIEGSLIKVQTDPEKCEFGVWLGSEYVLNLMNNDPALNKIFQSVKEPHDALHASAVLINNALNNGDKELAEFIFKNKTQKYLEEVATIFGRAIKYENTLMDGRNKAISIFEDMTGPEMHKTQDLLEKLMARANELIQGQVKAVGIYTSQTAPNLVKTQQFLGELRKEAKKNILTDKAMLAAAQSTKRNVAIVASIAILAGIFLAFIIARGIVSVLKRITMGMGEGADQVASASSQVSSSSQSMAEGASEQAASIEETSSSMEEMSSMTKKNAENASHADNLMKESNQVVIRADESMDQLIISMEEISKASEETSKIIKTIDEIAFQTNLLALNAAVEAARAGEAGAGFAVVADEVKNLAMRSADAAKNTAELIEGTMKKVTDGSALVTTTNEAFSKVAESSGKVGELVAEISEASKEQSEGIEQVNLAITEMDKVVQQNAANAEESASASEEMNAQAEQLRDYVGELMMMVTGKNDQNISKGKNRTIKPVSRHLNPSSPGKKKILSHNTKEIRPDQVIPFDDEEFENF
jgi:methyl-accepting chemotaxis protein